MTTVITYGTFDLFHHGHLRLLERAHALGDYLIVGVTSDDYDKARGKINVQQSLSERIENVRSTGLADKIVIEEHEGQKIDDILHFGVDIFTVGSDWVGKFDYLSKYCRVVYLDRTCGVSSSEVRAEHSRVRMGFVGEPRQLAKFLEEATYVNGVTVSAVQTENELLHRWSNRMKLNIVDTYEQVLDCSDAVYIDSLPSMHANQIRKALSEGKHVLCEAPIALSEKEAFELVEMARNKNLVLMQAIKTEHSVAFKRMIRLAQSGVIGKIVSVEATCTSLEKGLYGDLRKPESQWGAMMTWGPTAYLPICELLGIHPKYKRIKTAVWGNGGLTQVGCDSFTHIEFEYDNAIASILVGKGMKSEGCLIVSGTKGYIYVPSPWWKMDYFELRFENESERKRFYYQLLGEGIRDELVDFVSAINRYKRETREKNQEGDSICYAIAVSLLIQNFIEGENARIIITDNEVNG